MLLKPTYACDKNVFENVFEKCSNFALILFNSQSCFRLKKKKNVEIYGNITTLRKIKERLGYRLVIVTL